MALLIGVVLALGVGLFGTVVGLDRERSFYPTVLVVIAILYCLFAVLGGSSAALRIEALIAAAFVAAAVVGFRSSLWIVAAGLAAHGVMDLFHGRLVANPGVPPYWPDFCLAYDVVAAGYLAWRIASGRVRSRPGAQPAGERAS